MLIHETPFHHWMNHFYGYGSWNAKVWFVSHEEDGGDLPEEVAEKLNYFYDAHSVTVTPTLIDIRETYRRVSFRAEGPRASQFKTMFDYRFGETGIIHGIWKNLIGFTHGFLGEREPDLLAYQKQKYLATSGDREALISLYPLPSPHSHAWYYSWLQFPGIEFLKSRARYEQYFFERRINVLLDQLHEHNPSAVLMYGMNNINGIKDAFVKRYPSIKFKLEKAVPLKTPQYHLANVDGTTIIVTSQSPALKHNRIETGFDWYLLGQQLKSE